MLISRPRAHSSAVFHLWSCFAAAVLSLVWAEAVPAAERPNVVLIISDDQRWTDFGFMGHDVIRTPHLDRLAARSAVFPRGYVPTSLCRPSLVTMITGLYPHQHKVTGNDPPRGTDRRRQSRRPARPRSSERRLQHLDGRRRN